MEKLTEYSATELYQWYADLEDRILEVVRIVPFIKASEMVDIRSPKLAPILLESASLVDALFRVQMPDKFVRGNKNVERKNANIQDYFRHIEPQLELSGMSSLLLVGIPDMVSPFANWSGVEEYVALPWWKAYNELKHNRLSLAARITLEDCIHATCALNQLMMKTPEVRQYVFRHQWVQLVGENPQIALESLGNNGPSGFASYSKFFSTFLFQARWRTVADIRPVNVKNRTILEAHLGRLASKHECGTET